MTEPDNFQSALYRSGFTDGAGLNGYNYCLFRWTCVNNPKGSTNALVTGT